MNKSAQSGPAAQIFDRGYRRYDGERTGLRGALNTLIKNSLRQTLGFNRAWFHKTVPLAIVFFAFVPAIVFVGTAALLPESIRDNLPSYPQYYGFIVAAIYLLAAHGSALLLCTDRRSGMLGVYLASPLDRRSYLVGKAIAFLGLLLIVTWLPVLLMLVAFTLENSGPDGFVEWIKTFARIAVAAFGFGVVFAAPSLAVASTTDRWVVAMATNAAMFPGSAIVTDLLVESHLSPHLRLANLANLPRELTFRIHGELGLWSASQNPTWTILAASAAWVVLSATVVWINYKKLLVRR